MTEKERIGKLGEDLAARYLKEKEYQVLERNFKQLPWGEVDIIAKKKETLFFIEVKTVNADNEEYLPENKIDYRKKRALYRIIQIYLQRKKLRLDINWQLDAVIIRINSERNKYTLKHLENIFY
ncbi:MAG: YraN family protein [Candidatus Paceibacterota bacterium]|jgi:putative endonuclease